MSDVRMILERGIGGAAPPPDGFERMLRRHDRKRRNQRITAGVVGLTIAIAIVVVGTIITRSERSIPADPTLPFTHNGLIAIAGNHGSSIVSLIDPRTGGRSELTVCPDCGEFDGIVDLAWSPDGTKLAFTVSGGNWPDDPGSGAVGVFDVATNEISTIVTCDPSCFVELGWSPDGSHIALAQEDRLDLLDPDGSNRVTLADFGGERGHVYGPTWAPDGGKIAFSVVFEGSDPRSQLYRVDADGSNLQMLLERPGDSGVRDSQWSPDGSRIAYMAFFHPNDPPAPAGGFPQVWIVDADGSNPTKLFTGGWCCTGYWTGVSWAPDGTGIAFIASSREPGPGNPRLYLIDPDDGEVQVLAREVSFGPPAWQPVP